MRNGELPDDRQLAVFRCLLPICYRPRKFQSPVAAFPIRDPGLFPAATILRLFQVAGSAAIAGAGSEKSLLSLIRAGEADGPNAGRRKMARSAVRPGTLPD
jgi:hypothetical protein